MDVQPVEAYLLSRGSLPKSEIDWALSRARMRVLEPGADFCHMGDESHQLGLLLSGLLRVFTVLDEGSQITLDFVFPVAMVAAAEAAMSNTPSQVTIEALEASSLAMWPFSIRDEALARHPAWGDVLRVELENLFRRKNRYARALQTKDAATRYQEWVESHREAMERIPQYFIASYLGITPQHLSRIRARLDLARGAGEPEAKDGEPR